MGRAGIVCLVLVALASLALTSCGGSDGGPGPGDTTPPTITSMSPADGADDVGLIERVEITFSEAMDPATINDTTVVVTGRTVRSYVDYDVATRTAHVLPETLYVPESSYEIVVTDDVADEAGNVLSEASATTFDTGVFDCEHLEDYLDPNDEIGNAVPIELDVSYPTLAVCGDDDDYYRFTLTEAAKITARTSIKYAPRTNWGIDFLRLDGEWYVTLGTGAVTGAERSSHFSFNPGTYVLRIFGHDDPVYVLYDLVLETSAPCEDDEYEDNDFIDEAQPITTGHTSDLTGCYLDADFYTFDVVAGQTVTLTATQHQHEGSPHSRMRIYDPSGSGVSEDSDAMVHTIELTMEDTGTCTIMVRFWADLAYDLDIDIES